ncbi:GerAB/ArcD/ProY family transporter [Paenibacillus periandrae]|uniref:GerAB/ArcD/ProY family transporter n=1 Tax=Paenibacillus periandrae TaxID=1761741 RepID=UPI001F090DCA|nr:endospore germination permease [Paenibacillus periandrae]
MREKLPLSSISPVQLATLLFAVSVGSAIVYIPNPLTAAAGNDAWMSLLLAYGFGIVVLTCVLYLYNKHDGMSLIGYSRRLIGNAMTIVIALPLIGMLLFAIPAVDAGIGNFLTTVMMDKTPPYVFNSISLIIAALTARAGIQVTARMFVLLVALLVIFSFAVLIIAIPLYDPERLLPLLDNGFKPVLHGFFIAGGFPFGEVALFSMILPFVNRKDAPAAIAKLYTAFTYTAVVLILSTLCTTMAFGAAAATYNYSLYRLASEIQVPEIFQRSEAVIAIALILGSYMKATILLLVLNQIIVQLFHLSNEQTLIYPITLICILLSLTLFNNPADFEQQVYVIWPFTVIAVGCSLIFLFAFITWIKNMTK